MAATARRSVTPVNNTSARISSGDQDDRRAPVTDTVAQRIAGGDAHPPAGPGQLARRGRQAGCTTGDVGQARDGHHGEDQSHGHPGGLTLEGTEDEDHAGPGAAQGNHETTDPEEGTEAVAQSRTDGTERVGVQGQATEHGRREQDDAPDVLGVGPEDRADRRQEPGARPLAGTPGRGGWGPDGGRWCVPAVSAAETRGRRVPEAGRPEGRAPAVRRFVVTTMRTTVTAVPPAPEDRGRGPEVRR